jgi:hypothetical protein
MNWPNKGEREKYEIEKFIESYKPRNFEIIKKDECPDYIVRDIKTGELFGVELTSVYLTDRSVPDEHISAKELAAFKLTEQSYEKLKKDGLPEGLLSQLKRVENPLYTNETYFVEVIEKAIGPEQIVKYKSAILKSAKELPLIPLNRDELNEYARRIVKAIKEKVSKAKRGYDLRYPLILSVYVNEYRAIFMRLEDWKKIIHDNDEVFDFIYPFHEVLFWGLAQGDVLLVTPRKNSEGKRRGK